MLSTLPTFNSNGLAGGIQAFFAGNITIYTELCEHARAEAFALMMRYA